MVPSPSHSARTPAEYPMGWDQSVQNDTVNYYNEGIIIIITLLQNRYINIW